MNIRKLKQAEANFLQVYPDGFADAGLDKVRKSHNVDQLSNFARENLTHANFNQPGRVCEDLLRIVSRSSMVSRFEKPPFRRFIESLNSKDKERFARAFEKRLFGRSKQAGFEEICEMLAPHKLAKWSLVSAVPFYLDPGKEAFVKPTTAKGIISYLEIEGLEYKPGPTWAFYRGYQKVIADVRKLVVPGLAPNNAALTGFLMMSMRR